MRYIQRDSVGNVIGHYSHRHDYAQEEVVDNHPDILAWQAKREVDKDAYLNEKRLNAEMMQELLAEFKARKANK